MKCPNDQTEMEKGSLMMNGTSWVSITNWFVRGWHLGAKKSSSVEVSKVR